jgi:hypothetical protein
MKILRSLQPFLTLKTVFQQVILNRKELDLTPNFYFIEIVLKDGADGLCSLVMPLLS